MKSNYIKLLLLLFVATTCTIYTYGQTDTLEIQRDKNSNKIIFARFSEAQNAERKFSNTMIFLKKV